MYFCCLRINYETLWTVNISNLPQVYILWCHLTLYNSQIYVSLISAVKPPKKRNKSTEIKSVKLEQNGWRKSARGRPCHVGAQLCQRVAAAVERRRLPPTESAVRVGVRVGTNTHTNTHTHTRTFTNTNLHQNTHTHSHTNKPTYTHMHSQTQTHAHTHTHKHKHTHGQTHTQTHLHKNMKTHTHAQIFTNTNTHTKTCTYVYVYIFMYV